MGKAETKQSAALEYVYHQGTNPREEMQQVWRASERRMLIHHKSRVLLLQHLKPLM